MAGMDVVHECAFHEKRSVLIDSKQLVSYEKLRGAICNAFQLPGSTLFSLQYSTYRQNSLHITNDHELRNALDYKQYNPEGLQVVHECSPPIMRVVYEDTKRLQTLPSGQLAFCYQTLQGRVRTQFNIAPSTHFVFTYKEHDISGPPMTIASDEELKYVLEKELPNLLDLHIRVIEKDNADNICRSSGRIREHFDDVKILHKTTIRRLVISPAEMESACEKLHTRIRDVFNISLDTQWELSYVDKDGDTVTISEGEKLKDVLSHQPCARKPWRLDVTDKSSAAGTVDYVIKIKHNNGGRRRLAFPADGFQFSYERFQKVARDLFKLKPAIQLRLSYTDEDGDRITMADDKDLRDALLLQSLRPLMVDMTIIDGDKI